MRTGNIGAFRLTNVASAYYKGDEKNPQLQRIYGTAFKNKKELEEYFAMLEEAKKRDHRKLGKEMEFFVFDDDVGPGCRCGCRAARRLSKNWKSWRKKRNSPPVISACGRRTSRAKIVQRAVIFPITPSRCSRRWNGREERRLRPALSARARLPACDEEEAEQDARSRPSQR